MFHGLPGFGDGPAAVVHRPRGRTRRVRRSWQTLGGRGGQGRRVRPAGGGAARVGEGHTVGGGDGGGGGGGGGDVRGRGRGGGSVGGVGGGVGGGGGGGGGLDGVGVSVGFLGVGVGRVDRRLRRQLLALTRTTSFKKVLNQTSTFTYHKDRVVDKERPGLPGQEFFFFLNR